MKQTIRTRFVVALWNDLYKFENIGKRNDELIYAWMAAHGIELNETNWCAISKIYTEREKSISHKKIARIRSDVIDVLS